MTTIAAIRVRPLLLPLKTPYHWSHGVREHFAVNLVEVTADDGTVGLGECTVAPDQAAAALVLERLAGHFVGRSPYDVTAIIAEAFQREYVAAGAMLMRAANGLFSGFDMALWDLQGRRAGLPVHRLFGGAHRDRVGYFHFVQGDTPEELAADAARGAAAGERVFYLKVGRGEELDVANARAVRAARSVPAAAARRQRGLGHADRTADDREAEGLRPGVPGAAVTAESPAALARLRRVSPVPIAADQMVSTPQQVFEVCRHEAADVIVLGIHETGGLGGMRKAAAVAEAAGLNICLHGVYESGITTCASNQVAATVPNLDDGNQIMVQLLAEDIVASPPLATMDGRLPVIDGPGWASSSTRTPWSGPRRRTGPLIDNDLATSRLHAVGYLQGLREAAARRVSS